MNLPAESTFPDGNLYQVLLNTIPSSVVLVSKDLRIAMANRNFLDKNQRTEFDTTGRRLRDVFPSVILDCTRMLSLIERVFETGEPTGGDRVSFRAPGGLMRIYYYRVLPLPSKQLRYVVLLMEDVTEQARLMENIRRTERHLAIVVESTGEIILSTDTEGKILSWNKSAEIISGYKPFEAEGRLFHEFCAERHQHEVRRMIVERVRNAAPLTAEWVVVRRDGAEVPVSWTCSPMMGEQAEVTGIVAVGRDLTESRKLEAELMHAQKLVALGVMAGGIAHELRNPLAICSSAAQFLADPDITPEFRRASVEKLMNGMQRASAIIEHLLNFARPSARGNFSQLDLLAVLRESMEIVANQAKIQNIEVIADLPSEPVPVDGDAHLLQQVFINLFINAIHAMPSGGILKLSMTLSGSQALVRVEDSGCGIAEEDLHNIFEPFFNKPGSRKGTGLGLPLSYYIVRQHGGSLEVASIPGRGSSFTVKLERIGA